MNKKPMKTSTRLFLMSGIFFILTYVIIVALVNYSMRQQALIEAKSKIDIMAEQYYFVSESVFLPWGEVEARLWG